MRLTVSVVAAMFLVATVGSSTVQAGGDSATSGSGSFDVSAEIAGRYADPPGIWVNPCVDPFVWTSERLATDAGARGLSRVRTDGVTEYLWEVSCKDPVTGALDYVEDFWVSAPSPEDIVLDLMEILPAHLKPPDVTWPNMNRKHGWLFVKVPMDFRINNLNDVTVTATVTNAIGTSTGSATAKPGTVTFSSGEGGAAECTAQQAREPYVPRSFGTCAYTYNNSSSVAANGYSFSSTTTMSWDITSTPTDPTIPATLDTFTSQFLPVSEVQAVVTCVGGSC